MPQLYKISLYCAVQLMLNCIDRFLSARDNSAVSGFSNACILNITNAIILL